MYLTLILTLNRIGHEYKLIWIPHYYYHNCVQNKHVFVAPCILFHCFLSSCHSLGESSLAKWWCTHAQAKTNLYMIRMCEKLRRKNVQSQQQINKLELWPWNLTLLDMDTTDNWHSRETKWEHKLNRSCFQFGDNSTIKLKL